MKKLMRTFALMAVAALGLSACTGEKLVPDNGNADGKFVTVHFGAEAAIEGATKATLTTEDEKTFKSAWENGDALSVEYISPETADNKIITATWDGTSFEAKGLPNETGAWDYTACYPKPDEKDTHIDFGRVRTQKGSAYNSIYDVMIGNKSTKNSAAGKDDDGSKVVFNMTRQTAVAYFHLTGGPADEKVVSATLSVEGGFIASQYAYISDFAFAPTKDLTDITITFDAGTAPKASDFQLWYNVLPTDYDKMTLTVETANHTLTISRNATGKYEAGKLYKVVKNIPAEKWVKKGGETPEPTVYVWDLSINSTSEASENQIGWTNDAADMLCVKGKSTTAANNYYPGTSGKSYTSTRFYNSSTLSITPKVGKSLCYYVFEATTTGYAEALVNSAWTNATASVDAANAKVVYIVATDPAEAVSAIIGGTCGFTKVECHKDALSLTPVIKPASTSITVPSNGGEQHITYTILYPEDGKALTAVSSETTWITSINCETAGTVSFVAEANEGAERTATITLSYPGAEDVVVDVKQGVAATTANDGSLAHPYTAAEAIDVIDSGTGLTGKYVKGIVKATPSFDATYSSLSYDIVSGEATLYIYSGRDLNNADFVGAEDLKAGDEVVVLGNLKKYTDKQGVVKYELDKTNYLISINGETEIYRGLAVSGQKTAFTVGDAFEFGGKVLQVWRGKEDVDVTTTATFSGYNMSKEGKQTVTVTVGKETVAYEINVRAVGGEATKTYTLQFGNNYNSASIQDYTSTWSVTCDEFTWDVVNWNNNQNGWNYVKAGSKKAASVATITTNTTMPEAISTVTMTIDAIAANNVNSIKLEVLSADGKTVKETINASKLVKGDCVFNITNPQNNCKYKITVDCKQGSSNGLVQVSKVVYTNN